MSVTFIDKAQLTLSIGQTGQLSRRSGEVKSPTVIETHCEYALIAPRPHVYRQIHLRLDTSRYIVPSPFHQKRSNWRVMRNLLKIHRTPVHPTLIGLP